MKNIKYYFDAYSASYIPIETKEKKFFQKKSFSLLSGTFLGLLIGICGFVLYGKKSSQTALKQEVLQLKTQYIALSKESQENQKTLEEIQKRDQELYRSYFQLDTLPSEIRKAGFGGIERLANLKNFNNTSLIKQTAKQIEALKNKLKIQEKSLSQIKAAAKNREVEFAHTPAIKPIADRDLKRLASGFGLRIHPILKVGKMHEGLDFAVDQGKPIYATADGKIEIASAQGGYGNVVLIDHLYGYKTKYAHLSGFKVKVGEMVKRGDVIGYVGSTGMSSGPHLHYEISKNEQKVDPIGYFYQDVNPESFKKLYQESQKMSISLD
ncbi:MAG: peptidase M23 [Flavobacteriaceae bacterium]|nr:MAG: peptidase M23 [Flavobacteriaceae bacterium]